MSLFSPPLPFYVSSTSPGHLSPFVFLCLCLPLSLYLSVSVSVSFCLAGSLSLHVSVSLSLPSSLCPFCLSASRYVCLLLCLYSVIESLSVSISVSGCCVAVPVSSSLSPLSPPSCGCPYLLLLLLLLQEMSLQIAGAAPAAVSDAVGYRRAKRSEISSGLAHRSVS